MEIESLAYSEFYKLSDKAINESDAQRLLNHALGTKDDRNFKLATVVKNYPSDSEQINNPGFDRRYRELRQADDPEQILSDYSKLVSEFHNK